MACVTIENGPFRGQSIELDRPLVLGRLPTCGLMIDERNVSRRHAEIRQEGDHFVLVDLGSRNGTYLNGQLVKHQVLKAGDAILVGSVVLRFLDHKEATLVGQTIGGYEVLELVGSGGMGKVYRARQLSMDRIVALKVLSDRLIRDKSFVDQFLQEARHAGKLSHRNAIQVYDVNCDHGRYFFSMEFVDGPTVLTLLEKGPLTPLQALEIGLATAEALDYAHKQGIVHGDVKPQNIMISSLGVKLADLGLARSLSQSEVEDSTRARQAWGTPKYMAPELASGGSPNQLTDLYALGSTMYQMLTGRVPFTGSDAQEILRKHMGEALITVREVNPKVPEAIARVVESMLEKDPAARPQSMEAAMVELNRAREILRTGAIFGGGDTEDVTALNVAGGDEVETSPQRSRTASRVYVVVIALLVVLLLTVTGFALFLALQSEWFGKG